MQEYINELERRNEELQEMLEAALNENELLKNPTLVIEKYINSLKMKLDEEQRELQKGSY